MHLATTNAIPEPTEILERLARIEAALQLLLREKTVKEWYSTAEVAALLGKSEYTVREWCRQSRVRAIKKAYARGAHAEWLIGHAELQRLRSEGLLPVPPVPSRTNLVEVESPPSRNLKSLAGTVGRRDPR
jgi:hypothetical protein